ncbi:MAG: cyclic pyranopterin monophosphate synthase MoaC [Eubacteriales bacterium]|nr:cyclic pyranopterin monophosphate synthase MoaC [Eubacteriales bacterium]
MRDFTHFNEDGRARMVDVGEKPVTIRTAEAEGRVIVNEDTFRLIGSGGIKKGDVLTVAQVAGIMGAKQTASLIPMCHPVQVSSVDLDLTLERSTASDKPLAIDKAAESEAFYVLIRAKVSCIGQTGVEMEALTAVSTAALTVYDMCKAVQRDIEITDIHLVSKTGGVHGEYHRS